MRDIGNWMCLHKVPMKPDIKKKLKNQEKNSLKIKEDLIRLFFWTDNVEFYGWLVKENLERKSDERKFRKYSTFL